MGTRAGLTKMRKQAHCEKRKMPAVQNRALFSFCNDGSFLRFREIAHTSAYAVVIWVFGQSFLVLGVPWRTMLLFSLGSEVQGQEFGADTSAYAVARAIASRFRAREIPWNLSLALNCNPWNRTDRPPK